MNGTWLNGRKPLNWELPAIERGYGHFRQQDLDLLDGLLAGQDEARPPARASALLADVDIIGGQL